MNKVMYKVDKYYNQIQVVNVTEEFGNSIWIESNNYGREIRLPKTTEFVTFVETSFEAKSILIKHLEDKCVLLSDIILHHKGKIGHLKSGISDE